MEELPNLDAENDKNQGLPSLDDLLEEINGYNDSANLELPPLHEAGEDNTGFNTTEASTYQLPSLSDLAEEDIKNLYEDEVSSNEELPNPFSPAPASNQGPLVEESFDDLLEDFETLDEGLPTLGGNDYSNDLPSVDYSESLPEINYEDSLPRIEEIESFSDPVSPGNDNNILESLVSSLMEDFSDESNDDNDWDWEEIGEDESPDGFISADSDMASQYVDYEEDDPFADSAPIEYDTGFSDEGPEIFIEELPEFEAAAEDEDFFLEPPISEEEEKPKKGFSSIWKEIKKDFGGDEEPEKEEEEDSVSAPPKGKGKGLLKTLATPYLWLSGVMLKLIEFVLGIVSYVPFVGKPLVKLLKSLNIPKIASLVMPGLMIVFAFYYFTVGGIAGKVSADFPDNGSASFNGFSNNEGIVSGKVKNTGEVILEVEPSFRVYALTPSLNPKTWVAMEEVASCTSDWVEVDIDIMVEVSADCGDFNGLFIKVSGDLSE